MKTSKKIKGARGRGTETCGRQEKKGDNIKKKRSENCGRKKKGDKEMRKTGKGKKACWIRKGSEKKQLKNKKILKDDEKEGQRLREENLKLKKKNKH